MRHLRQPIPDKNFTLLGQGVMRYLGGGGVRPDPLVSDVVANTLGNRMVKVVVRDFYGAYFVAHVFKYLAPNFVSGRRQFFSAVPPSGIMPVAVGPPSGSVMLTTPHPPETL